MATPQHSTTHTPAHSGRHPGGHSDPHRASSTRPYYVVYGILMVLLVVTVLAAQVRLGPLTVLIAFSIAAVKALLVLIYFMHLRGSNRLIWIFAAAGFLWLGILFTLVMSDYLSRGWIVELPG